MTKKILIADDEVNIVISLEFLIKQAGYEMMVSRDGEDALQKVAEYEPDLVLLDVMMPRVNGFEVCRRIRENPEWQDMKVVMLTAKGREVEMTKGLSLGADAYVIKPFSTKELMILVKELLGE